MFIINNEATRKSNSTKTGHPRKTPFHKIYSRYAKKRLNLDTSATLCFISRMAYTVSEHLKDAAVAKQKREDAAWNRKHKKALRALMTPTQLHKELREKRERAEKREANRIKRATSMSVENLRRSFRIVAGEVMLNDAADPSARIIDRGHQVMLFGKSMWTNQLRQLLSR